MHQHVKKRIRIAGVAQEVQRQDPQLFKAVPARVCLPLIRRIFHVFSDEAISGIWQKTKVISVIVFFILSRSKKSLGSG
jgi:hypothetical protein